MNPYTQREATQAVKASIQLVGNASAHMSYLWREEVVCDINKSLVPCKLEWEIPIKKEVDRIIDSNASLTGWGEPDVRRSLVPGRGKNAYKLSGATLAVKTFLNKTRMSALLRLHGSGIHQQPRRSSLQGTSRINKEPMDVVPGECTHHSPAKC